MIIKHLSVILSLEIFLNSELTSVNSNISGQKSFQQFTHTEKPFFRNSAPKVYFLTVTKSVQIRLYRASIVNFAEVSFFALNGFLKSVHHCDIEKLFYPNKHQGSEPILTFRNAQICKKNLESALSCCNFVLASLLKHAPFWRTTIPI